MADPTTIDGRPVLAGAAQPVVIMNSTVPTTGGGSGGGGAVTVADGADVTQGAKADAAVTNPASSGSVIAFLKGLLTAFPIAALADTVTNLTAGAVRSFGMLWNGATWDRAPGNTSGAFVQGNIARGITDAGNPVEVGGIGEGTSTGSVAVTTGQRQRLWLGLRGNTVIGIGDANSGLSTDGHQINQARDANGVAAGLSVASSLYNGGGASTSFDRQRNNHEVTVLASASRAVDTNSADQTNYNARGVIVDFDLTVKNSTSITVTIKGKDTLSGVYSTILASAAIATTGHTQLKIAPGITVAANLAVADMVPRVWRVEITRAGGASDTYSVSNQYIN